MDTGTAGSSLQPWKCVGCGRCCTRMITDCKTPDWLRGVWVTKRELHWFPEKAVRPCLGVEVDGKMITLDWVMIEEPCPQIRIIYNKDHKLWEYKCLIWEYAPKACRMFPYSAKHDDKGNLKIWINQDCTAVQQMEDKTKQVEIPKRSQTAINEAVRWETYKLQTYGDKQAFIWVDGKWASTNCQMRGFGLFYVKAIEEWKAQNEGKP